MGSTEASVKRTITSCAKKILPNSAIELFRGVFTKYQAGREYAIATKVDYYRKMVLFLWRRKIPKLDVELSFTGACSTFRNATELYRYMHLHYLYKCPAEVRWHRDYFSKGSRGFGEDAMHAMWWLLMSEFRPLHCLEIGVYRGQIISLWALVARILNMECRVHGISPFTAAGDKTNTSNYIRGLDYYADVLANFDHLGLRRPVLLKGSSTDAAAARQVESLNWDMIYIDGCHDYDVAYSDYRLCTRNLKAGGVLIMDDAALFTKYEPPAFAFAGHPGPSRVASEDAMREMKFLGAVGHNLVFRK